MKVDNHGFVEERVSGLAFRNIFVHKLLHSILESCFFSCVMDFSKENILHSIPIVKESIFRAVTSLHSENNRTTLNGGSRHPHVTAQIGTHCYHKPTVKIITYVEPADSLSNKVSQTRK